MKSMHKHEEGQNASLLAKDQYMHEVQVLGGLTQEQEKCLLQDILSARSNPSNQGLAQVARQSRDELVEGLQWLVKHHAYRHLHYCQSMELLDLIQEGNFGLLEAIERYVPTQTIAFRGSASTYIRQAIWRGMAQYDRIVRLPIKNHVVLSKVRKSGDQLRARLGRDPLAEEVAVEVGISEEALAGVLREEDSQYVESLQAFGQDEEGSDTFEDFIEFVPLFSQIAPPLSTSQQELEQAVEAALVHIGKRQCEAVRLRYGLGEGFGELRPYELVGEMMETAGGSARQLERQAVKRLRPHLGIYVKLDERDLSA